MEITKKQDKLIITFPYNTALVEIMQKFDSRKFDNKTKEWSIPINHIVKVLEKLTPLGFKTTTTIQKLYSKEKAKEKKLERIRNNIFNDAEKKILKSINLPLFPFQKIGTGYMCTINSCVLGDEPGLGKSIQVLAVSKIKKAKKILIICPSSLKLNWKDEIEKWYPNDKIQVINGIKTKRIEQWGVKVRYYIVNYELLRRDINIIKKMKWNMIISDEATRISNPRAQQSKIIKTIDAEHKYALTGTPLNNSIQDLWNIMDFCVPGLLGNYWQFLNNYCLKDRFGGIVGYKNLNQLSDIISKYMIRRKKSEVFDELPDRLYEHLYIEFTPEENNIYEAVKEEIANELKQYEINRVLNDKYLSNALVKMIRLKQVTDSLELVSEHTQSSKLNVLQELLEDILHGDSKALIYTQFSTMADILMRELSKYNPLLISGKVDNDTRHINTQKFQNDNKYRIMILTEAGTYGLNLQKANYLIHYDCPWSISKLEQREGRAHRIGSKRSKLTIFKLIVKNSVDEYILRVLHKKQELSERILKDAKEIRKIKITSKDIKKILS